MTVSVFQVLQLLVQRNMKSKATKRDQFMFGHRKTDNLSQYCYHALSSFAGRVLQVKDES